MSVSVPVVRLLVVVRLVRLVVRLGVLLLLMVVRVRVVV